MNNELQRSLQKIEDHSQFIHAVVTKAAKMGFDLTIEDVQAAINNGRRSWIERWI